MDRRARSHITTTFLAVHIVLGYRALTLPDAVSSFLAGCGRGAQSGWVTWRKSRIESGDQDGSPGESQSATNSHL